MSVYDYAFPTILFVFLIVFNPSCYVSENHLFPKSFQVLKYPLEKKRGRRWHKNVIKKYIVFLCIKYIIFTL